LPGPSSSARLDRGQWLGLGRDRKGRAAEGQHRRQAEGLGRRDVPCPRVPSRDGPNSLEIRPGRAGGPRKCVILRDRSLPSFGHRSGTGYSAEMPGWHAKAATAGGCLQLSDRSRDSMQDVDLRNFVRVISACTLGLWAFAAGLLIGVFWLS
jgi:hypothetical protein